MEITEIKDNKIRKQTEEILKLFSAFDIEMEIVDVINLLHASQIQLKARKPVRMHTIESFKKDICHALGLKEVEIEAPILGKSLIGINIPKPEIEDVLWKDVAEVGKNSKGNLIINIGKDAYGNDLVLDLRAVKHFLMTGSTGSGKSILLHNIICTLLSQNDPDTLKLILSDPKRVELTLYNKVPHLLTDVLIDAKKPVLALKWTVKEISRRFDVLEKDGAKDIYAYKGKEQMPHIVIVVDEFSDIMQSYPKETEPLILKIAQTGHTVGVHIILSTSRPSTNIITKSMKDVIDARVALQTASVQDSKTIIDMAGAENLRGSGDMLFQSGNLKSPIRGQIAYISEKEIKSVVKHVQENYPVPKTDNIKSYDAFEDTHDDLYEDAREAVVAAGKASTSYIQRKLGVGYSRAAQLMDMLEAKGVISSGEGAKPREVIKDQN